MHKLKTLSSMLTAVFAMSAIGVSAASAAEFHTAVHPQTVNGSQTTSHVFTTTSGTVTCKTATFSGTTSAITSTTQTVTPNYDNCTAFGFIGVPVHENGCDYTLYTSGTTNLVCPTGKEIQITVPGCTTSIGSQHLASGPTFHGSVTKSDITVTLHYQNTKYKECDGVLREGGTYTGSTTMTGASGNIWYE